MDASLPAVATRVPASPGRGAAPYTFRQLRERWPLLIPLAVLVPLALGVAAMVDGGRLLAWDAPITAFAVDHRTHGWNAFALFMSRLGSWMVVFPAGAALALAATGGGRVTGTEVGDEESYYEVEVTLDDGSQVDVQLDESFHVVGRAADHEDDASDDD